MRAAFGAEVPVLWDYQSLFPITVALSALGGRNAFYQIAKVSSIYLGCISMLKYAHRKHVSAKHPPREAPSGHSHNIQQRGIRLLI